MRLGHMGPAARSLYPLVAVGALGRGLADLGVPVDVGAGAQAAMAVLSAEGRAVRLAPFRLHRPQSVEEATAILDELGPDALAYCGGTELLLIAKLGLTDFSDLVDVKPIAELGGLDAQRRRAAHRRDRRRIARSSARRSSASAGPRSPRWNAASPTSACATSARSAATSASPTPTPIRRPGCSPPAARSRVRRGGAAARRLALEEFVRGPYETALEEGELLLAVHVPAPAPASALVHRKMSFQERPAITVAVEARLDGGIVAGARVAVGSVGRAPAAIAGRRGGARRARRPRPRRAGPRRLRRRGGAGVRAGRRRERLGRVQAPARAGADGTVRARGARRRGGPVSDRFRQRGHSRRHVTFGDQQRCRARGARGDDRRRRRRGRGQRQRPGDRVRARGLRRGQPRSRLRARRDRLLRDARAAGRRRQGRALRAGLGHRHRAPRLRGGDRLGELRAARRHGQRRPPRREPRRRTGAPTSRSRS